jgi:hypothetical protein
MCPILYRLRPDGEGVIEDEAQRTLARRRHRDPAPARFQRQDGRGLPTPRRAEY